MQIGRLATSTVRRRLSEASTVVLLGPRQVGKTTLARDIADAWPAGATYLDLERPADRRRLDDTDGYLRSQSARLVVLDEVHRLPGLFEVLRGVIDDNRRTGHRTGQFLLLGSASLDLMHMSSESLAGRVSHVDLAGVNIDEARDVGIDEDTLWLRGGFPDSLSSHTHAGSLQWREDLIRSYLEREVPMFAPRIPAETLRRLWTMVAHTSGGLLNSSRLAAGLAVSGPTVDRYLDLLVDLGLLRRLQPWHTNTGKRLVRSPKVYVRDTGLLHALLGLRNVDEVLGHPAAGPSWESFVVEAVIDAAPRDLRPFHYRTARGDEVDLVLVRGGRPEVAVEIKRSTSSAVSGGFRRAIADLGVRSAFLAHPHTGSEAYRTDDGVTVTGLLDLVERLRGGDLGS